MKLVYRYQHQQDYHTSKNLPIWILWGIWKSRNRVIFQQKQTAWRYVLQYAQTDANEWRSQNMLQQDQRNLTEHQHQQTTQKKWRGPDHDWIKCNVDGSFVNADNPSTMGWILRDSNGVYRGAGQASGRRVKNAFESELQALIVAMQHCWSKRYKKVVFESDCQKMVNFLNKQGLHFDGYNWIREIYWWKQQFQDIKFIWIARKGNKVADTLAKSPLPPLQTFVFHFYVPRCISPLL